MWRSQLCCVWRCVSSVRDRQWETMCLNGDTDSSSGACSTCEVWSVTASVRGLCAVHALRPVLVPPPGVSASGPCSVSVIVSEAQAWQTSPWNVRPFYCPASVTLSYLSSPQLCTAESPELTALRARHGVRSEWLWCGCVRMTICMPWGCILEHRFPVQRNTHDTWPAAHMHGDIHPPYVQILLLSLRCPGTLLWCSAVQSPEPV